MMQENCEVVSNKKINNSYYSLKLKSSKIRPKVKEGQFVLLKVNKTLFPFLRRPFSVAFKDGSTFSLIYKVVGEGTEILAEVKRGEILNLMGPLGNSYTLKKINRMNIIIAGGIGIAGVLPLLHNDVVKNNAILLYGVKSRNELYPLSEIPIGKSNIRIFSEDGTIGERGYVIPFLKEIINKYGKKSYLYICGPIPMIRAVASIAVSCGVAGEGSAEERMACGVGACLGCSIELVSGRKRVCKDGPVFPIAEYAV